MKKCFFIFLFTVLVVFSSFKVAVSSEKKSIWLDYFSTEIKLAKLPLSFEILWSTYGSFSVDFTNGTKTDVEFPLGRFDIENFGEGVYEITLYFTRKIDALIFSNRFSFYFFDNGQVAIFKTFKGKRRFKIPDRVIELKKIDDGFRVVEKFPEATFELPVEKGEIFLKVKRRVRRGR